MTNIPQWKIDFNRMFQRGYDEPKGSSFIVSDTDNTISTLDDVSDFIETQIAQAEKRGEEMKKKCLEVIPEIVTSNGEDDKIDSIYNLALKHARDNISLL